jgi:hypothetical protein
LRSCIDAWETLRPPSQYSNIPPSLPITQISSAPVKRKPPPESLEPFAAAPPPKRRQSGEGSIIGAQRVIQPKPSSNGQSPISFSSPQSGQQPKKRDRLSKADVEDRRPFLYIWSQPAHFISLVGTLGMSLYQTNDVFSLSSTYPQYLPTKGGTRWLTAGL